MKMRAKTGAGVKPKAMMSSQRAVCFGEDSANLSAIEKASFLEGLQQVNDDPLHSTAIEEEPAAVKTGQLNKGTCKGPCVKTRLPVVARKRKNQNQDPGVSKRGRPGPQQKVHARPEAGGLEGERTTSDRSATKANTVPPTGAKVRGLVRKSMTKSAGAGGPKSGRESVKRKKIQLRPGGSGSPQGSDPEQQSCGSILSSSKDEDTSWKPEPHRLVVQRFGRGRRSGSKSLLKTSSSGGGRDQGVTRTSSGRGHRRKGPGPPGTDLELILEAFLQLCDSYRDSVESSSVRDLVHLFSTSVEEEISEKIILVKDLRGLKRENTKVSSLIRSTTQRLLEAKNELMRQERRVLLLQKEESELTLRLSDLRRSHRFLHDLRHLSQQQEDQQQEDQQQPQTYGASSLPALVLEARHVQTTDQQLRSMNQRLAVRLDHHAHVVSSATQ